MLLNLSRIVGNMGEKQRKKVSQRENILESIAVVILAFYPLRHISWGLDLWDTGYNYANFQYMGTEHMDPMWLFSTYLATAVGNLLTKLPSGGTLLGMNFYTGLFASMLALLGYFFCTRGLKIPKRIAFVGELTALSLCWCPTALLYNYLSYLFFLGCVILLYYGLIKDKKVCLIGAGVCLGANVLVRFSNLPEAAMIVAVWAYDVLCLLEERRGKRAETHDGRKEKSGQGGWHGFRRRLFAHTGWCLLGYAAALAVLLGWIWIRYGLNEYAAGIGRLFAMTDKAADYKPTAMITGMLVSYAQSIYWVTRIGVFAAGGLVMFAAAGFAEVFFSKNTDKISKVIHCAVRVLWVGVCAFMLWWLYDRQICSFQFYSYDSMLRPGVLFLMLAMLIGAVRILHRDSPKEEKLISGMLILVILLTSLGSNNGVYPSLNNLFVAAPYTLWESWRFIRDVKDRKLKHDLMISPFPVKGVLTAFLALCLFQFGLFGFHFAFAEATGIQDVSAGVEGSGVLKNIKMSPEKARWMTEISAYLEENGLWERELILYGNIPALSYYLQMPSAFNPWSSLDSYSRTAFAEALAEVEAEMAENEAPVIIIDREYSLYMEGGSAALEQAGVVGHRIEKIAEDEKLPVLADFIDAQGYRKGFDNGKFAVFVANDL